MGHNMLDEYWDKDNHSALNRTESTKPEPYLGSRGVKPRQDLSCKLSGTVLYGVHKNFAEYHEKTYVHYCAEAKSEELFTWGGIEWKTEALNDIDLESAELSSDDLNAHLQLNGKIQIKVGEKTHAGDGAVPIYSSSAPKGKPGVLAAFAHGKSASMLNSYCKEGGFNNTIGYRHKNTYADKARRELYLALYSPVRLSKKYFLVLRVCEMKLKKSIFKLSIFYILLAFYILNQPAVARPTEGTSMTQWTTHYFGRFKLNLPANSEILADYKIYNEKIELASKNGKAQLDADVKDIINKLNTGVARGKTNSYEKTVSLNNGSILVLSKRRDFYTINAYLLTSKNTLYRMEATAISEQNLDDAINKIRKLSDSIFFRVPREAPPSGAFSLEAGYTTLPPDYAKETVYMGAQIANHPGTYVSLLTQRIARQEESLIERFDNNQSGLVFDGLKAVMNQTKTLRKRERMIGNIKAEEVAVTAVLEGKKFYDFQVEYKGTLKSNVAPYMALELGTHEVGSDFKSDEEALAFWDQVLVSLQPLP